MNIEFRRQLNPILRTHDLPRLHNRFALPLRIVIQILFLFRRREFLRGKRYQLPRPLVEIRRHLISHHIHRINHIPHFHLHHSSLLLFMASLTEANYILNFKRLDTNFVINFLAQPAHEQAQPRRLGAYSSLCERVTSVSPPEWLSEGTDLSLVYVSELLSS